MQGFWQFTTNEAEVIFLSVKVALISTIITIPIAVMLGKNLARKQYKVKAFIESLITLPLVAPPVVTGFILLFTLGRNSLIGTFLYDTFGIRLAFNFTALVIASFVVSFPLAVRSIKTSFELIDPSFEQASLTLGASKTTTFFRVSLPLAMPGIISGTILSFARSLGEFGAGITFAGNIEGETQTIAFRVYSMMQVPGQEMQVFRLVSISLLISLAAMILSEYLNRKRKKFAK